MDLDFDAAVRDPAQVDEVVARAAFGDDLLHADEGIDAGDRLVDVELRRPHHDAAVALGLDEDALADVARVALQPSLGVGADVQREDVPVLHGQDGRSFKRNVEGEDRDARELEAVRDREQAEIDLVEGPQEQVELPADVEDCERIEAVGDDVARELVEADLAVGVQVGEVEVDVGRDAAFHAGGDEAQREPGADGDLGVQHGLGPVEAGHRVEIVQEEAVDQVGGVVRHQELLEAQRVVAEPEVELAADLAREGADDGPEDRNELSVEELEAELGQLDLDQRDGLAHQQLEDVLGLEDREVDRPRLGDALGEFAGLRAGCLRQIRNLWRGRNARVLEVLEVAQVGDARQADGEQLIDDAAALREIEAAGGVVEQHDVAEVDHDRAVARLRGGISHQVGEEVQLLDEVQERDHLRAVLRIVENDQVLAGDRLPEQVGEHRDAFVEEAVGTYEPRQRRQDVIDLVEDGFGVLGDE